MHTTEKENEYLEVFLDYFVCVLPVCTYMLHMCVWCPQRSGEGAGCPGVGVTDSCGPCGCWEHVLITAGPTLSWQWLLFKVLLWLLLPYSVLLNPLTTVQLRASPLRSEQTDHWSSPSRQGSDSPTDLLLSVLGKTATPRSDTMKQFPSQPSFPGRCWRTPKQKACVFPQVLAHKGGPGRERRMLGTATKGPVNKVTKKRVWLALPSPPRDSRQAPT